MAWLRLRICEVDLRAEELGVLASSKKLTSSPVDGLTTIENISAKGEKGNKGGAV